MQYWMGRTHIHQTELPVRLMIFPEAEFVGLVKKCYIPVRHLDMHAIPEVEALLPHLRSPPRSPHGFPVLLIPPVYSLN